MIDAKRSFEEVYRDVENHVLNALRAKSTS